ncbi:MAG: TIGR00282 family metallophosphoesterase [Bacteroidota bacterium]|nr:TIGR00282 family metallophosphoesterase [Candidatus Kapabacteria bacterium]MDW8219744.1 TIGR00282 family metallophosphoesterase [Bacteroidota bacterium]
MVTILFIGDVVGQASLQTLVKTLPSLYEQFAPHGVIVNGENIVDGKGLSEREATMLFQAGVHVITTGNHIWENWKARPLLSSNPLVLRPQNYPAENPGSGVATTTITQGYRMSVIQLQGRTYMQALECPFRTLDAVIERIAAETPIIIVDFHAEATGEKVAMGYYADGRVSAILGTHTHIQTADAHILPCGTAYITDVGMTGPVVSVIGMKIDVALKRFLLQTAHKYELGEGFTRISGVVVKIDESTGKALAIEPFMLPEIKATIS